MKKVGKKGSHVGMVLSFVVFVVFLVFIYTTLQPLIKTQTNKDILLEFIQTEVQNAMTANVTTITLITTRDLPQGEMSSNNCIEVISESLRDGIAIVKDADGNIVESSTTNGKVKISWGGTKNKLFKIYSSEENFEEETFIGGSCVNRDFFQIGTVRDEKYIFQARIQKLKEEYFGDHELLRQRLSIPLDSDFSINVKLRDVEIPMTIDVDKTDVFAKQTPIQYMDSKATINSGYLEVKVW